MSILLILLIAAGIALVMAVVFTTAFIQCPDGLNYLCVVVAIITQAVAGILLSVFHGYIH